MLHRHEPFIGAGKHSVHSAPSGFELGNPLGTTAAEQEYKFWKFNGKNLNIFRWIFKCSSSHYFPLPWLQQMLFRRDEAHTNGGCCPWISSSRDMSLSPCRMAARSFVRRWWKDSDWALIANVEQKTCSGSRHDFNILLVGGGFILFSDGLKPQTRFPFSEW